MADKITFERNALFEEVWTDPVSTVAKRYELPDHTLRKICKELGVPTPSGGYWPALRLGKKKPERATLPPHTGPMTYEYVASSLTNGADQRRRRTADERRVEHEESAFENKIVIASEGGFRDPFVKAVAKYLADAEKKLEARKRPGWHRTGQYFFVKTSPAGCIDPEYDHLRIIVTKELRSRALHIADAFLIAIRKRGFAVTLREKTVLIEAQDVSMRIRLTELERRDGVGLESHATSRGLLRLSLRRARYENGIPDNITVTDEPGKPIEDQMNLLIAKLRTVLLGASKREAQRKADEVERVEKRRVQEEDRRLRELEARQQAEEAEKIEKFFVEADEWLAVEHRRQYLEHLERVAGERGMDLGELSALRQWLTWARSVCDSRDPVFERLRKFVGSEG